MNGYNQDMAIILPACDQYLDVVSEYMRYLRINWDDCPFEIILVTETEAFNDPRVSSYTTSKTTEWTGRVLEGLKHTNCRYALVMIEDAFFSQKVNNQDIYDILDFIKKHGVKYYRNPKKTHVKTAENAFDDFEYACKIKKDAIYARSLGIDIWDRNALLETFGDGTMSAWDVENYFLSSSMNETDGYYEDWVSDTRNFLHVIETVAGGKWIRSAIKNFEDLGTPVNLGERKLNPVSDEYRRRIHSIANRIVPKEKRVSVKRLLSKVGFKFATKY